MGFLEVLTLIFIVLKLMGVISWGWLAVLSPLIASLIIYVLFLVAIVTGVFATGSKIKRKK
jgi:hypothetical protein